MEHLIHRAPSVGSVLKKIMAINPDLSATEMIGLIRQSTEAQAQSGIAGEFAQAEVINEEKALRLAKDSLSTARPASSSGTPGRS
jgi:hypothetical protein